MRKITAALMVALFLVSSLTINNPAVLFGTVDASTDVSGIISQDTTWTTTGSPYTLTNKALVPQGVTLTIQPGVTVNLGDYYLEVNGTLTAKGTSDNPIQFISGEIFLAAAQGWNEQTGTGCIIENAILDGTTLGSYVPVKINQCTINAPVNAPSSILSKCNINTNTTDASWVGSIWGSTIVGYVGADNIINNRITGKITPALTATGNVILGNVMVNGNCTVSNNYIQGDITVSHVGSIISGNTIVSPDTAIAIGSEMMGGTGTTIKNNRITAAQYGIKMPPSTVAFIYASLASATITDNVISGCSNASIQLEDDGGENSGANKATVEGNVVSGSCYGIYAFPKAIVQGNLVVNNHYGIQGGTISHNTIANNVVGVFGSDCHYNNIEDSSEYNFVIGGTDVTNNWWGTTDAQAIGQTIYDSKFDFDLDTVTFQPFLTAPDPAAPSLDYMPNAGSSIKADSPLDTSPPNLPTSSPTLPTPTPTPPLSPSTTDLTSLISAFTETTYLIALAIVIAFLVVLIILLLRRKPPHERF